MGLSKRSQAALKRRCHRESKEPEAGMVMSRFEDFERHVDCNNVPHFLDVTKLYHTDWKRHSHERPYHAKYRSNRRPWIHRPDHWVQQHGASPDPRVGAAPCSHSCCRGRRACRGAGQCDRFEGSLSEQEFGDDAAVGSQMERTVGKVMDVRYSATVLVRYRHDSLYFTAEVARTYRRTTKPGDTSMCRSRSIRGGASASHAGCSGIGGRPASSKMAPLSGR